MDEVECGWKLLMEDVEMMELLVSGGKEVGGRRIISLRFALIDSFQHSITR